MLRNTNSFCRIKKDKRANNIFETFPPKIKVNVMHTGFEMPVFPKGNCHLTVVEVRTTAATPPQKAFSLVEKRETELSLTGYF